ncbi:MAG TPA: type II secretion system F family protein [Verrucomicrobiae bacterium]|nr:type II secretion system F family protein [Verrucomicrobiae bacterium]
MPLYTFTAINPQGQEINGSVEAPDQNQAAAVIKQQYGAFPTRIVEQTGLDAAAAAGPKKQARPLFKGGRRVPSRTLTVFTRQLATLIDAGLPLLRGLGTLEKQEKNVALRGAIHTMAESVEGGSTFSEAMASHPLLFNRLYVNMVKAGEVGGVLEVVLTRLAEFQEKAQKLKNRITSAMVYPLVVLVLSMLILVFLLTFIVPRFQQIFSDMLGGKPLPALTQFVIDVSHMIKTNFIGIAAVLAVIIVGFKLLSMTQKGAEYIDRAKLRMPLIGPLVRLSAIARFSRTLGTLITSGVPILQALNITKETAGNIVLSDAIAKVHDAVKEGESVVAPLEASGVFPPMVISMIDVGEETGRLPDMLIKVSDVYDDEVDNAVAGLTSMLEPLLIVFLAVIVGTIVVALFMPLIEVIKNVGSQTM